MKIYICGSSSGTEPIPSRHHSAWILQTGSRLYQFDAGENCVHQAYTNGYSPCRLQAVFITHPHFDHIGGLPHLLWTIRKITAKKWDKMVVDPLPIYISLPEKIEQIQTFLSLSSDPEIRDAAAIKPADGVIFDDGCIKVEAFHNEHLGIPEDRNWLSFSYRIKCEGKTIIDSGDLRTPEELRPMLDEKCDLLLMESGHHHPWETAETLNNMPNIPQKLLFRHHGRDILERFDESAELTRKTWQKADLFFAADGMTLDL